MAAEDSSLDTLACLDLSLMTLPFNRRVSLRYPCGLATSTRVKLDKADPFRRVMGHNISQGGMALILTDCPEVGIPVNVRVKNSILDFTYDLAARIVHVAPTGHDEWLVGLAFARQLSLAELASLL
jgi:hypothetical protein